MSEQPQGPGWWLASDGKYYPPQTAPYYPPPSDSQAVSTDGVVLVDHVEPSGKRSLARQWWFWTLLAVGVLVIIGLLTSGGGNPDEVAGTAPSLAESDEPEAAPTDSDGDGVPDSDDDFPNNPDAFDESDRDGDGVRNEDDFDPDDPAVQEAPDRDGDGVPDSEDAFPRDPERSKPDKDGDGVPDDEDDFPNNAEFSSDRDGDRVPDSQDDYPNDPTRSKALTRADFPALGEREWAIIAKNPDVKTGQRVVVYAEVSQFDAATGPEAFLAWTEATQGFETFDFSADTPVFYYGKSARQLENVIEGDFVKVWGTVEGSFSYDTQAGGNTTVPLISVEFIEVYGSG